MFIAIVVVCVNFAVDMLYWRSIRASPIRTRALASIDHERTLRRAGANVSGGVGLLLFLVRRYPLVRPVH
jgi:hypothetical protein